MDERRLDLPPGYTAISLRESGDAFAHACAIAGKEGAGTFVHVRRYDLVEFAVVLEPDEPLGSARRAFFAGMHAVADAIAAHCPPEREVAFAWPDAILFDGGLVGGGRLGWPEGASEDADARLAGVRLHAARRRPQPCGGRASRGRHVACRRGLRTGGRRLHRRKFRAPSHDARSTSGTRRVFAPSASNISSACRRRRPASGASSIPTATC